MESLDQLHNILAQERKSAESKSPQAGNGSSKSWTASKALEEAAAELDEFFGKQEPMEDVFDEER